MMKITFTGSNFKKTIQVKAKKPIFRLLEEERIRLSPPPIAAIIDNCLFDLDYKLKTDSAVELISYRDRVGASVYRRSLSFILHASVKSLFPKSRLVIGQSISNGYYYDFEDPKIKMTQVSLKKIKNRMHEIIKQRIPFIHELYPKQSAIKLFAKLGYPQKVKLLETLKGSDTRIVSCAGFSDISYGPMLPHTGFARTFDLQLYNKGFILVFPDPEKPDLTPKILPNPSLFKTYMETKEWNKIIGVRTVSDLNNICINGDISEAIKVAEALHEKKIIQICDKIKNNRKIKIILVAGPSASGKTTTIKRLSIQLAVNNIHSIPISLDDYFLDREKSPLDENGEYDFETPGALDIKSFNKDIADLLAGKKAILNKFSFSEGKQVAGTPCRIPKGKDFVIIIEGLHAINPRLLPDIGKEKKLKIYLSALTQLCIDDHNRIFTSDTRLLRRLIRDCMFRGYSAADTLSRWYSVRKGEEQYIFPYQNSADIIFNSALVYEHAVLKIFAERFLLEVRSDRREYVEATRLLDFLNLFVAISPTETPPASVLREFIGGSAFAY
ncbi:MAG: nucleoside kinase [Candidatus Aureabacteria bacterium]|nr:nucleoside kinase [Candidatus Auribacterota bacterium]